MSRSTQAAALLAVLVAACHRPPAPAAALPTSGTVATAQAEPSFAARAVSPIAEATPLQVVSVFAYEPGEQLISPATEIASFVADARVKQGYGQQALQPLLVAPKPVSIKADRLLVIAWGKRSEFSLERVKEVGRTAMRETLKMGVDEMAYAPIARDQGVTSIAPGDVAAAFVEGALGEYLTERGVDPSALLRLRRGTFEAGPTFVDSVAKAIPRGVEAARAHASDVGR